MILLKMDTILKELFLDFDTSFLTYIVKDQSSYGRFQIDSVCSIQCENNVDKYYVLHPVMACDVYGTRQLIKEPAYRFQAVFSKTNFKIFRTYLNTVKQDNTTGTVEHEFEGIELNVHEREMFLLDGSKEICSSARSQGQIYGRISFPDGKEDNERDVTIDFPVRHINTDPVRNLFQVETGTIALPDYTVSSKNEIDLFSLYYIAFNSLTCMNTIALPVSNVKNKDCIIRLYGVINENNGSI